MFNILIDSPGSIIYMSYTDVVRELLEEQYPDPDSTDTIVISQLVLRILPAPVKPLFLRYHLLETLVLTKCDLRNLDNFPRLVSLKNLDLSDNSLQGSLNYLMPLTSLNYLSLANNLIADHRKLLPLQVIDGLQVFLAGNPFLQGETWKNKIRGYGLKVLKQARVLQTHRVKQEEKKEERKGHSEAEALQDAQIAERAGEVHRRGSLYFEMKARRQRRMMEQEERAQARRNMLEVDSDSLSMFEMMGEHDELIGNILNQEGQEESEEMNEESDNDDSDNDKKEDEDEEEEEEIFLNNQFAPLLDVFDADDLELGDGEDHSEEDSDD